ERREFVLQPLDGRPVGDQRQGRAGNEVRVDPVEEAYLAALALLGGKARLPQELLGGRKGLRSVRVEAVERAGLGKALELAAVKALCVEAPRKVGEVLETPPRDAPGD